MSRKALVPLVLPLDPVQPLEAATKQYVDAKVAAGDDVWIGPTDPIATVPTIELWYDSDAVAPATPANELLYSQFTADVTITATSAATAQSVINPGNVTYDGLPVMIEFYSAGVRPNTTLNAQILLNLFDGNTDLGYISQVMTPAASTMIAPVYVARRLTPTAGAHNYNVRAWIGAAGSGLVGAGPGTGAFPPGFIRVTRV